MNRKECLDLAAECVLKNRADVYGPLENGFAAIAGLWVEYLGAQGQTVALRPADVAAMMALMKIGRIAVNPKHADSWADLAGYAACGAECATGE